MGRNEEPCHLEKGGWKSGEAPPPLRTPSDPPLRWRHTVGEELAALLLVRLDGGPLTFAQKRVTA